MVELPRSGPVRALRRKRANVQLVKHVLVPGPSVPTGVGPRETRGVDHKAGAMHAVGLKTRSRIGNGRACAVEPVPVSRAGSCVIQRRLEPTAAAARQRRGARRALGVAVDNVDAMCRGGIQTKTDASVRSLCTKRHIVPEGNRHRRASTRARRDQTVYVLRRKSSATPFMQKRRPVGLGPSSKT